MVLTAICLKLGISYGSSKTFSQIVFAPNNYEDDTDHFLKSFLFYYIHNFFFYPRRINLESPSNFEL